MSRSYYARSFGYRDRRRYHARRSVEPSLQGLIILLVVGGLVLLSNVLSHVGQFFIVFFPYILFWIIVIALAAAAIQLVIYSMRAGQASLDETPPAIDSSRELDFKYAHSVSVEHTSLDIIKAGYHYLPYVKHYLMTRDEKNFFHALQEVVKDSYYIVPQVMWTRIVAVDKNTVFSNKLTNFKYHNLINRNSVDFVLFTKPHFDPALIIELDGPSHNSPKKRQRDQLLDALAKKVGIYIVHIQSEATYQPAQIQDQITRAGLPLFNK